MQTREKTDIPGCYRILSFQASDARGSFRKCITSAIEPRLHLGELFYTRSARGVFRGMHLQEPPHEQYKLLFCVAGRAFDVLTDLRNGSPTFRKTISLWLDPQIPDAVLVPPGVAHGFLALADDTVMVYLTSSLHSPEHDSGIRWTSLGIDWPIPPEIISDRDQDLTPMDDYKSPFSYNNENDLSTL